MCLAIRGSTRPYIIPTQLCVWLRPACHGARRSLMPSASHCDERGRVDDKNDEKSARNLIDVRARSTVVNTMSPTPGPTYVVWSSLMARHTIRGSAPTKRRTAPQSVP